MKGIVAILKFSSSFHKIFFARQLIEQIEKTWYIMAALLFCKKWQAIHYDKAKKNYWIVLQLWQILKMLNCLETFEISKKFHENSIKNDEKKISTKFSQKLSSLKETLFSHTKDQLMKVKNLLTYALRSEILFGVWKKNCWSMGSYMKWKYPNRKISL